MGLIKFLRGLEALYQYDVTTNSGNHKDAIYFATDTGKLYMNGTLYGGDDSKKVANVEVDENNQIKVSYTDGSAPTVINLIEILPEAEAPVDGEGGSKGLLSAADKATIDEVTSGFNAGSTLFSTKHAQTLSKAASSVADGDKMLTLTEGKISATVGINYNADSQEIELLGKNNEILDSISATPFIKDGVLDDVEIVEATEEEPVGDNKSGKYVVFTWKVHEGEVKTDWIPVADLAKTYEGSGSISISKDNVISVAEVGTDITKTTAAIDIIGGPLSDELKAAFGSSIPAGTTIQDVLLKLACTEKWPTTAASASYGSLTSTLSAPSLTVPTDNGKCVKIGTAVTLGKVTGSNASANQPYLTYDNFAYGYATSVGKHTATTSESNPPSVKAEVTTNNVTYTLKKEYTGFGKTTGSSDSTTNADGSQLSFASEQVSVVLGKNAMKYTLSVSGQVHSATVKDTNVYYALSNLGNTNNDKGIIVQSVDKTTTHTYTPNPATPASKSNENVVIYGVYPIYHNVSTDASNLASNTVEVVGTSKDQVLFEISYKNDSTNPCSFSWPSDRTLTVQLWNGTFNKWENPPASNQKTQATETKINNVTYNQWIYTGEPLYNNGVGAKFKFTLGKKISE